MAHHSDRKVPRLSRRLLLAGFALGLAAPAFGAGNHPSMATMRRVAKDMLNAHRQGTVGAFRAAIQRHSDLNGIADYCLGQYRKKLPAGLKSKYYGGVATFMARYFADQSRQYPISKYVLGEATADDDKTVSIDSKVYLMSGQTYTVVWKLGWVKGGYKVTDVKVMGFSLVYLQRGLFTSFINKRGGDVAQLVAALNR